MAGTGLVAHVITAVVLLCLPVVITRLLRRRDQALGRVGRTLLGLYLYVVSFGSAYMFLLSLAHALTAFFAAFLGRWLLYGDFYAREGAVPIGRGTDLFVWEYANYANYATPKIPEYSLPVADLLSGIIFAALWIGVLFLHQKARRDLLGPNSAKSRLYRTYLLLGAAYFGLIALVFLAASTLNFFILRTRSYMSYMGSPEGVGNTPAMGLIALPICIIYIWLFVRSVKARRLIPSVNETR